MNIINIKKLYNMNSGVYKLIFSGTSKVYIGQAQDLTQRFKRHLTTLKNNRGAKKLQEAYNTFGPPKMEILHSCSIKDLNTLEDLSIIKYNSVLDGFNTNKTSMPGNHSCGEASGCSKYSNDDIICTFFMLLAGYTAPEIYAEIGIPETVTYSISRGSVHKWLNDLYPQEYTLLLSKRGTRATKPPKIYPIILNPDGLEYTIDTIHSFSIRHSLDSSCLSKVLQGKRLSHKGWKVKSPQLNPD